MKSWLRIFLICFALLGGTAFFGYWYMGQLQQVFDDLNTYYLISNSPSYPSFSRSDKGVAEVPSETAELATTTESLTTTTTDEIIVDEEIIDEPVVFVLIKETSLGYLNARTGPGIGFEKIAELESGNTYELIDIEGEWYNLKIDEDVNAWVISTFVELPEDL